LKIKLLRKFIVQVYINSSPPEKKMDSQLNQIIDAHLKILKKIEILEAKVPAIMDVYNGSFRWLQDRLLDRVSVPEFNKFFALMKDCINSRLESNIEIEKIRIQFSSDIDFLKRFPEDRRIPEILECASRSLDHISALRCRLANINEDIKAVNENIGLLVKKNPDLRYCRRIL